VKLHIFNPEHDIALAYDKNSITLPHAIQEFKMNLGFLPALWADDGDCILVEDIPFALKALKQTRMPHADVLFLNKEDLKGFPFTEICPWGWNRHIRTSLLANGVNANILPTDDLLLNIRMLSSRKQTSYLLDILRKDIEHLTCGESFFINKISNLKPFLDKHKHIVVKAPWSSSGRGLRYIKAGRMSSSTEGWVRNIIKGQGGIMAEPCYNRLKDFAMEFYSHGDGRTDYRGLSVFGTDKGCYTGNLVACEEHKKAIINKYIGDDVLTVIKGRIIKHFSNTLAGIYRGPFGIDMMIVADNGGSGYLLHPCVEVNLRMTMGHVANSFRCTDETPDTIMNITHDVNYKLRFEPTANNFVKVI